MDDQHRLKVLDGLRAIAILLVLGYHYFSRWAPPLSARDLYPYGDFAARFWLFRYGDLGVELFFVISGFVISMTLFRSRSIGHFFWKRFARLFPSMLLCSLLTFAVLHLLPQQAFMPHWRDFAPSWTFTDPLLWSKLFGVPFKAVDGVYWSLFVEVKFYLLAGLLYFSVGARRFLPAAAAAFAALVLAYAAARALALPHLWAMDFVFVLGALPWFAAGIGFYALHVDVRSRAGWVLLAESLIALALLRLGTHAESAAAYLAWALAAALFLAFLLRPRWVAWLAYPPLAAIGVASYSLYLLHQSIGVALLDVVRTDLGGVPRAETVLLVPLLAAALIAASWLIYRYWEVPAKNMLLAWPRRRRALRAPPADGRELPPAT